MAKENLFFKIKNFILKLKIINCQDNQCANQGVSSSGSIYERPLMFMNISLCSGLLLY